MMELDLIGTYLPQQVIDKGIAAAKAFFDDHLIIPDFVYKHVLAAAQGRPYIEGFIEIWERAFRIALEAACQGRAYEGSALLILRDCQEYKKMA